MSTAAPVEAATPHRILFDKSKAETAGNADWTGAISAWGVVLQRTGDYSLKTLPSGGTLTYGTSAATDLRTSTRSYCPNRTSCSPRPRRLP